MAASNHRECPHCHAVLTTKEAIQIMNGSGYKANVRVVYEGHTFVMNASDVNPAIMDVIDDESQCDVESGHGTS